MSGYYYFVPFIPSKNGILDFNFLFRKRLQKLLYSVFKCKYMVVGNMEQHIVQLA